MGVPQNTDTWYSKLIKMLTLINDFSINENVSCGCFSQSAIFFCRYYLQVCILCVRINVVSFNSRHNFATSVHHYPCDYLKWFLTFLNIFFSFKLLRFVYFSLRFICQFDLWRFLSLIRCLYIGMFSGDPGHKFRLERSIILEKFLLMNS